MQKEVLSMLLDMYESSVTYKGINTKNQSFSVNPVKVFPDYDMDYTDQDEVDQFNTDMESLRYHNLIWIDYVKGTLVIEGIKLNTNSIIDVYQVLDRVDITQKRCREIDMYLDYMGMDYIIDAFCEKQIERLNNYKDAKYAANIALNILKLLKAIMNNKQEIMERELSIAILGDTKLFENSFRTRVCNIIEEYGNLSQDVSTLNKKEKEKSILEEFQVFSNPSYVFFKGNVEIDYIDGSSIVAREDNPIAISSEVFEKIHKIKVNSKQIVTVENLTSYNRINDSQTTFIYLSGYHNTAKQNFLIKTAEYNKDVAWYHFGDIDPDGYFILKNLISKTGIQFEPLYMGVKQLIDCKQYCKPLEKNDVTKARTLIDNHFYDEVMNFMLVNNCKLEQEIVSWLKENEETG